MKSQVRFTAVLVACNDTGQVVHTCMLLLCIKPYNLVLVILIFKLPTVQISQHNTVINWAKINVEVFGNWARSRFGAKAQRSQHWGSGLPQKRLRYETRCATFKTKTIVLVSDVWCN